MSSKSFNELLKKDPCEAVDSMLSQLKFVLNTMLPGIYVNGEEYETIRKECVRRIQVGINERDEGSASAMANALPETLPTAPTGSGSVKSDQNVAFSYDSDKKVLSIFVDGECVMQFAGGVSYQPYVCEHVGTERISYVPATCTEDGYSGDLMCKDCNEIIEFGEVIPALGHDYAWTTKNGVRMQICKRCGAIGDVEAFAVKDQKLTSIADAMDAVEDGGTIKLMTDVMLTDTVSIEKNCTMDLNGHKLSVNNEDAALNIAEDVKFTVENGTVENTAGTGIQVNSNSELTVARSVTVSAKEAAVYAAEDCEAAVMNINGTVSGCHDAVVVSGKSCVVNMTGAQVNNVVTGVSITGEHGGCEVKLSGTCIKTKATADDPDNVAVDIACTSAVATSDGNQKLTIESSTIEGKSAVKVMCTDVEVSGFSKLKATGTVSEDAMSSTEADASGYALAVLHNGTDSITDSASGTIELTGGNFLGAIGIQDPSEGEETSATISATGGKFNTDVTEYVAEGYQLVNGEVSKIPVKPTKPENNGGTEPANSPEPPAASE